MKKKLRILINFHPCLSRGGGDRHLLDIAVSLAKDFEVSLLTVGELDASQLAHLFALDLSDIKIVHYQEHPSLICRILDRIVWKWYEGSLYKKLFTSLFGGYFTKDYDIFLNGESGGLIINRAPIGIHMVFFPIDMDKILKMRSDWLWRLYILPYKWFIPPLSKSLASYHFFWANSQFTAGYVWQAWRKKALICYPKISCLNKPLQKFNKICLVSRYTCNDEKGHAAAIEVFRELVNQGLKNWELILAGTAKVSQSDIQEYLLKLEELRKGYPIKLLINEPTPVIANELGNAKILWHFMGFKSDLMTNPEKAEHFGMPTVEGMMAGCVPITFKGGGQLEIIQDGINGFLWSTIPELKARTLELCDDDSLLNKMSEKALERSQDFSESCFEASVKNYIEIAVNESGDS